MGLILQGTCARCGYREEILTGGGLRDCDPETALSAAPGDPGLAAALQARGRFRIERFPAVCVRCRRLTAPARVTYWTPDGGAHETPAICPACGGPVKRGDSLPCPVCGGPLELRETGHWD